MHCTPIYKLYALTMLLKFILGKLIFLMLQRKDSSINCSQSCWFAVLKVAEDDYLILAVLCPALQTYKYNCTVSCPSFAVIAGSGMDGLSRSTISLNCYLRNS